MKGPLLSLSNCIRVTVITSLIIISQNLSAQIFQSTNPPGNAVGNPDAVLQITTEDAIGAADTNLFRVSSVEACIQGDGKNKQGVGDDPEWKFDISIPPGALPTCTEATLTICRRGDFGEIPEIVFVYDENGNEIGRVNGLDNRDFDCAPQPECTTITLSPCAINEQGADGVFELTFYTNGQIGGNTVGDFCGVFGQAAPLGLPPGPQTSSEGITFQNQDNGGPMITEHCYACNCAFIDAFEYVIEIADPGFTTATSACVGDPVNFISNANSTACAQEFSVDGVPIVGSTWTPSSPGIYTICSVAGPLDCRIEECKSITVDAYPEAPDYTFEVCEVTNFNPYSYANLINPSGEGNLTIFTDNSCSVAIQDDTEFNFTSPFPTYATAGGTSGTPFNLAMGGTASQSGTEGSAEASLAIDGNNDPSFANGSVSLTNSSEFAWWSLDLGSKQYISNITIWERNEFTRTDNIFIFVSDTPISVDNPNLTVQNSSVWNTQIPSFNLNTNLNINRSGRYILIQKDNTDKLDLAEVEVFGQSCADGSTPNQNVTGITSVCTPPATITNQTDCEYYGGTWEAPTVTTTLLSIDDVALDELFPTANFSGQTFYEVGYDVGERIRVGIQFESLAGIPAGSTITSATLKLVATDLSEETQTIDVRQILQPWTGGTATWNSLSASIPTSNVTQFTVIEESVATNYDLDITALMQAWYAGTIDYNGIMLIATNNAFQSVGVRATLDGAATQPQIEVTYTEPFSCSGASPIDGIDETACQGAGGTLVQGLLGTCTPPTIIRSQSVCEAYGGSWVGTSISTILSGDRDGIIYEANPAQIETNQNEYLITNRRDNSTRYVNWFNIPALGIPASTVVSGATFSIGVKTPPTRNATYTIHKVTTNWNTATLSWNAIGTQYETQQSGSFTVLAGDNSRIEVDILDLAQDWVTNGDQGYVIIPAPASGFFSISTSTEFYGYNDPNGARLALDYEFGASCTGATPRQKTFQECLTLDGSFEPNNRADQIAETVKYSIVSDNGCVTEGTITWDVKIINATITANTSACQGEDLSFSVAPGAGNYEFTVNDVVVQDNAQNSLVLNSTTQLNVGINTVSVFVTDPNFPCTGYDEVEIEVFAEVEPVNSTLSKCDDENVLNNDDQDGKAVFDLTDADALILNGITNHSITYHSSFGDADNGVNPLASPYTNSTNPHILFARVLSDINGCHSVAELTLNVETPVEPDPGLPISMCAGNTTILGGATPGTTNASWGITSAPSGGDGVLSSTALTSSPSTITFTASVVGSYILTLTSEDPAGSCGIETREKLITVTANPTANNISLESCDGTNTIDASAEFDIRSLVDQITGGGNDLIVTFHSTLVDANAFSNALADTIQSQSRTIFARVADTNECTSIAEVQLIVLDDPSTTNPIDVSTCAGTNASFTTTTTQGLPGYTYQWFESTDNGTNFNALTASATYVGADEKDLTIMSTTLGQNDNQYRLVVTDSKGCTDTSAAATITVIDCIPTLSLTKSAPIITDPATSGVAGNVDAEYTFVICNTSVVELKDISLFDNFNNQFGDGFVRVIGDPAVTQGANADATTTNPTANEDYDGTSIEPDMLNADGRLSVNECIQVVTKVEIDLSEMPSPATNQARTEGFNDLDTKGTDLSDDTSDNTSDDDPTPFPDIPKIGLAKHVVSLTPASTNGNYIIRYGYLMQNVGNVQLTDVELDDDIRTQFGANVMVGDATIAGGVTGVANNLGGINPSFTGGSGTDAFGESDNTDLFDGTAIIDPKDSLHIFVDVEVIVSEIPATGLTNQATVSSQDANGNIVSDLSEDGTAPDNSDTNNDGSTDTPTPIPNLPSIKLEKSISGIVTASSGTVDNYDVTFNLLVRNDGHTALNNLELTDNLTAQLGSAYIGLVQAPVFSIAGGSPVLPSSGTFPRQVFDGTSGRLNPNDSILVAFTIEMDPDASGAPVDQSNSASVSGTDDNGNSAKDISDDITDPTSGDDPTPIPLPDVQLAKRQVSAVVLPNGNWEVVFEMVAQNTGNVVLDNLTIEDNMSNEFGTALVSASVSNIIGGTTLTPGVANATFDGSGTLGSATVDNDDLLDRSGMLDLRETVIMTITTEINADNLPTTGATNQATVTGTSPNGTSVSDLSDNGTDPKSDNGEGDTNTPTPIEFCSINAIKNIVSAIPATSGIIGNFDVAFEVYVTNNGTVPLTNLTLQEQLAPTISDVIVSIPRSMVMTTISGNPTLPNLSGTFPSGNVFDGTSGVLNRGDTIVGRFTLELDPDANGAILPAENQILVTGMDPNNNVCTGLSDSGTDTDQPTPIPLPNINAAKAVVDSEAAPTKGNYFVTYRYVIQNTGNETLTNVTFEDDVFTQFGGTNGAFVGIQSTPTIVASETDAAADITFNVFDGNARGVGDEFVFVSGNNITLEPTEKITFDVIYEVDIDAMDSPQPILNRATTTGIDPRGGIVSDDSDNGSDPKGNNGADNNDGDTFTPFEIPVIEILKQATNVVEAPNGNAYVDFELLVTNSGNIPLNNPSVEDDLSAAFGSAYVGIVTSPAVSTVSGTPTIPTGSGAFPIQVFDGISGLLNPQDTIRIVFTVEVDPDASGAPTIFSNQAKATGTTDSGQEVTDLSDDVNDPSSGNDDPTLIEIPLIRLTKTIESVVPAATYGNYIITLKYILKNTGNTVLDSLQIEDDVQAQYGAAYVDCQVVSTSASTASAVLPTDAAGFPLFYDGISGSLQPGDQIVAHATVEINPGATGVDNPLRNQATGTAGTDAQDLSDTGDDPDGDNPGEEGDTGGSNDPTILTCLDADVKIGLDNPEICSGENANLTSATDLAEFTVEWYDLSFDPPNLLSLDNNFTLTNIQKSKKIVLLIQPTSGCAINTTDTVDIIISTPPTVSLSSNYNLNPDCSLSDLSLSADITQGSQGIRSFSWDGPAGFISNTSNPIFLDVTTAYNGTYSFTIIDSLGCELIDYITVREIPEPVATPQLSIDQPACLGDQVKIIAPRYEGNSVQYNWTIPATATTDIVGLNTPELILFPASVIHEGDYILEVVVDGCTVTSQPINFELLESPTLTLNATTGIICEGGDLVLNAIAGNGATFEYAWDGPNAFTSSAPGQVLIPNVTVANNGTYTVSVTNENGCTVISSIDVNNINEKPATPTISSNGPVCGGAVDNIVLTIQELYNGTAVTYSWTNAEGTEISTDRNVTIPALDPLAISPFSVQVTIDGCPSDLSAPMDVEIIELPTPIANNSGPYCLGSDIELIGNDVPGAFYEWREQGSTQILSTNQIATISGVTATTTYELTIVKDGCRSATPSATVVEIGNPPTINPTLNYTANADCSPADLTLMANATQGTAGLSTYSWSGPNGWTSVQENPIITAADASRNGVYAVTVSDSQGCTAEGTVEISTIVDPIAEPQITISDAVCQGGSITIEAQQVAGILVQYNWTIPATATSGVVGLGTNRLIISNSLPIHEGTYSLQVVVDGCTIDADPVDVALKEGPTVTASAAPARICSGEDLNLSVLVTSTDGPWTYEWSGPLGFTSIAANPVIADVTTANNGVYVVRATNIEGCTTEASVAVDQIVDNPEQPIILSNSPVCSYENIELNIQQTYTGGLVEYTWTNAQGTEVSTTSSLSIPADDANAIAPFSVEVIVDGCSSGLSDPFEVTIVPEPAAIANNSGPVCLGDDVNLNANGVPGASYEWRIQGSTAVIGTDQNTIISGLTATTTFELTINVNGCTSQTPTVTTVTVLDPPTVAPTLSYTVNPDCSPADLTLMANEVQGTATIESIAWTGPNGFASALASPVIPDVDAAANGLYTVVITDVSGCSATGTVEINTIVDPQAQPTITSSAPTCEGGEVIIAASAYSGVSVAYNWTMPSGTNVSGQGTPQLVITPATTVNEGDYTLTVTVDGCTLTSNPFTLDLLDKPEVIVASAPSAICAGESLNLTSTITAGNAPYTYAWTGPNLFTSNAANPVISNVTIDHNGVYVLTVTSIEGCSAEASVTVDQIVDNPEQPIILSNSPVCSYENIELNIQQSYTGGLVEYKWTNAQGTEVSTTDALSIAADDVNAIAPFSVEVIVDGCSSGLSDPFEVTIIPEPAAIANNSGPICLGDDVTLNANGVPGASYEWRIQGSTAVIGTDQNTIISGLTATTTFELTINVNGCTSQTPAVTTVTVLDPPTVAPTLSYTVNPDCSPADLTLMANEVQGTATIESIAWTGPNGFASALASPVIPGVDAAANGLYRIVVTDESGCSATGNVEINTIVDPQAQPTITSSAPTCEGGEVIIAASAYSGVSVAYNWTMPSGTNVSGQGTPQLVITPATTVNEGDYTLTVTVDGCTLTSNPFTLDLLDKPDVTVASAPAAICAGESLNLTSTITAGNAPYTYAWTGPNLFTSNAANPVISNTTIDHNGVYVLTVTSIEGCSVEASVTVDQIVDNPEQPIILSNSPVCSYENIELNIQQSYTGGLVEYKWTNAQGTEVSTTDALSIAADDANAIAPFSVEVMLDGCSSGLSDPFEVTIVPEPAAIANNSGPVCLGDDVTLNANGVLGASYEWRIQGSIAVIGTDQNTIISNLTATTTFELTINVNGCTSQTPAVTSVSVIDPPSLDPNLNYTLNPDCSPSDLVLMANATAGSEAIASYAWTGPNDFQSALENPTIPNATAVSNGLYTATVTDVSGCSATGTVEINMIVDPQFQPIIISSGATCVGGEITITSAIYEGANVTYNWILPSETNVSGQNSPQLIITPVSSINEGDYALEINVDGCALNSNTVNIDVLDGPSFTMDSGPSVICAGQSLNLTSTVTDGAGPYTYLWLGPNLFTSDAANPVISNVTIDHNGVYSLRVTGVDGCSTTQSITVDQITDNPDQPIIVSTGPVCSYENIELNIQQTYTGGLVEYRWTNGQGAEVSTTSNLVISATDPLAVAPFSVEIIVDGCSSGLSDPFDVTIIEEPTAIALNTGPICAGEEVLLQANSVPGASYEWRVTGTTDIIGTDQNTSVSGLTATTTYELTISIDGCTSQTPASTTVTVLPKGAAPDVPADFSVCLGGTISLSTSTIAESYNWSGPSDFSSTAQNPFVTLDASVAQAGIYTLTTFNAEGCESEPSQINVTIDVPAAKPVLTSNSPICGGTDLVLNTVAVSPSYIWTAPNGTVVNTTVSILTIAQGDANYQAGDWTLTLESADGCLSESAVASVTINEIPDAPLLTSNGPLCGGETGELSMDPVDNATYRWYSDAALTQVVSTQRTFTVANVAASIDYYATITIEGCISPTSMITLDVTPQGAAPDLPADFTVCTGETIGLSTTTVATSYEWSGPGGYSSSAKDPFVTTDADVIHAGIYTLITRDASGCPSAPASVSVVVATPPAAPTITQGAPICEGEDIFLRTSSQCASYQWIGPGGNSTSTLANPLLTTTVNNTSIPFGDEAYAAGMWAVICIDANGCKSDESDPAEVVINSIPATPFVENSGPICSLDDVTLNTAEVEDATYEWVNLTTNEIVSNERNPVIRGLSATTDFQLVIIKNGCRSLGSNTTVDVNTSPVVDPSLNYTLNPDCSPSDLSLSANATAGTGVDLEYLWTGPNGWSSVDENPTIPSADPSFNGSYTLVVTDENGCIASGIVSITTISESVALPQITGFGSVCAGERITLSVPTYNGSNVTYDWTYPGTDINISGLGTHEITINPVLEENEGNYSVVITVDGCVLNSPLYPVVVHDAPTVVVSNDGNECIAPNTDLQLNSTVTGGSGTYTTEWSGPNGFTSVDGNPMIPNAENNSSGIYTVVITDQNGCTATASTTVDVTINPDRPYLTSNEPICEGNQLVVQAPSYPGFVVRYNWSGPLGTTASGAYTDGPTIVVDEALVTNTGDYTVSVTIDGCTSELSDVLSYTVNAKPTVTANNNGTECIAAGEDLLLQAIPEGGTGNGVLDAYDYQWTGPNGFTSTSQNPTIPNAENLDDGTYNVTITDANGCMATASTVVDITVGPNRPFIMSNSPICSGNQMTIQAPIYTGVDIQYNWVGPLGSTASGAYTDGPVIVIDEATAANSGAYTLNVTVDGCTSGISDELIFTVNEAPTVVLSNDGVGCIATGDNVTLTSAVTGGSGDYIYLWTGPNGFTSTNAVTEIPNVDSDDSGNYTLVVTDATGCTVTASTLVDILEKPGRPVIVGPSEICESGSFTLQAPRYDGNVVFFEWTGPNGRSTANGDFTNGPILTVNTSDPSYTGEYRVTVTVDGCTSEVSFAHLFAVNPLPTVTAGNTGTDCVSTTTDISLLADAQGGAGAGVPTNYTYEWVGPNGFSSTDQNPTLPNASSELSGTYTVVITDAKGCSAFASTVVDVSSFPNRPVITANAPVCQGGRVTFSVEPAAGANVIYEWTVPDLTGVFGQGTNAITIDPIDAALHDGNYTVKVTVDGCSVTSAPFNAKTLPLPTLDPTYSVVGGCSGSTIQLNANGINAVFYEWRGPGGFISFAPDPIIINADLENNGTYTLVATSVSGCQAIATMAINEIQSNPETPSILSNSPVCSGDNIILSLQQNFSGATVDYEWRNGAGVLLGINEATVIIPATDPLAVSPFYAQVTVNGCTSEVSSGVTVDVTTDPVFTAKNFGPICEGEILQLEGSSNGNDNVVYTWYLGDPEGTPAGEIISLEKNPRIANLKSGDYEFYLKVSNDGCASTTSAKTIAKVNAIPEIDMVDNTGSYCKGSDIEINANVPAGATYNWAGPNGFTSTDAVPVINSAQNHDAGAYTLVISVDGCISDIKATQVDVVEPPVEPLALNDGEVCLDSDINLFIQNADELLTYEWFNYHTGASVGTGSELTIANATMDMSGDYYAIASLDGCSSQPSVATTVVIREPSDEKAFAGPDIITCQNFTILAAQEVLATDGYWTIVDPTNTADIITPNMPDSYLNDLIPGTTKYVWNLNSGSCGLTSTDTVEVLYSPEPTLSDDDYEFEFSAQIDPLDILTNDVTLDDPIVTIETEPRFGQISVNNDGTVSYDPTGFFVGTDKFTYKVCSDVCPDACSTATVTIKISASDVCDGLPNIFTPNGDGMNNEFAIPCLANYTNSTMTIFNRWGDEIFHSSDYQNDWTGTWQGQDLPVGTYYYICKVNDTAKTVIKGYVYIQR